MDAIQRALDQVGAGGWLVVYRDEKEEPGKRYWIEEETEFYLSDEQYAELANIHPRIILLDYVEMTGSQ